MVDRGTVNRRLEQYDTEGILGQWHVDGDSPDAAWLGGGNFGCVYGVFREQTDAAGRTVRQQAALKVVPIDEQTLELPAEKSREERQEALREERRKAERECAALRRLNGGGGHVVRIFSTETVPRTGTELESWDVLIVMDRLMELPEAFHTPGLRSGTRPYLAEVLRLWLHISDALAACQEHGMIHADVKPDNILCAPGPEGRPKDYLLCDFGTVISRDTFAEKLFFGTEDYMSPEMYARRGGDIRSDMYSLGVVIYELLNGGHIPFQQGKDRVSAYRRRLEEGIPIPRLKGVPEDVNDVLLRCLEPDPDRRWSTFRALEDTVRALEEKYAGRTGPQSHAKKGRGHGPKAVSLSRRALLGAAGAAAVIIAITVLVLTGREPSESGISLLNPEQEIHTLEDLDGSWVGQDEMISVSGTARADATLDVSVNGAHLGYFPADGDGVFEVEIPSRRLAEGENDIAVSYYAQGAEEQREMVTAVTVYCDTTAPEITVPQKIDQYTEELAVDVADNDEACSVALLVDGELIEKATAQAGSVTLSDIQTLGLTGESAIEVVAVDRANNTARAAVTFQWQPGGIAVTEPEGTLFNQTVGRIAGTAEPDAVLRIDWGAGSDEIRTDGSGAFALDLQGDWMAQGANPVTIGYTQIKGLPVEGEEAREITLRLTYDSEPPVMSVEPEQIVAGERHLQIQLEEEADYRIGLRVNGEFVVPPEEMTVGGTSVFETDIPEDVPLTKTSEIAVVAYDRAGNAAEAPVQYVSVDSVALDDMEALARTPVGPARPLTIEGTAEAGALLNAACAGGTYPVQADGDGRFRLELTAGMLQPGENTVTLTYAPENGYPERALGGTGAEAAVYCDVEPPQVTVSEQTLTRDTAQLTVSAANEPLGWGARLTVSGEEVWSEDDIQTGSVTIDGLRQFRLREEDDISLTVTDYVNDPVELALTYENTSAVAEALAWSETEDLGTAAAGQTVPVRAWALCSGYDMREGYVAMRLNGGAVMDNCLFTREQSSEDEFAARVQGQGVDLAYVDSLFAITGVTIPEGCPSGEYRLEIVFSTENDSYTYPLGTVIVEGQTTDSAGQGYVNAGENYAIGLDSLARDAFRPDGVVLTGWVYHTGGAQPYFDRCEIIDSAGRVSATVYFTDEVTLYPRRGVERLAGQLPEGDALTGGTEEDAGFVMRLDLSELSLADGQYTIQVYSSNRTGESAWDTVRTPVILDSAAPPVTEAALAALTEDWVPAEETPVPEAP